MGLRTVIKRNGLQEDFEFCKLSNGVRNATTGLSFDVIEFIQTALQLLPSLPTTSQIRDCLLKTAVERITLDEPIWDKIAVKLFLQKIFKEVQNNLNPFSDKKCYSERDFDFVACINEGLKQNKITRRLDSEFVSDLGDAIEDSRNDLFTYLGIKTLYDKYLIKGVDKNALETPQMMFMSISAFLATRSLDPIPVSIKYYNILSSFKAMVATPILANARTPRFQLNSCYVGSCGDSIESIFSSFKDMALISKNGGGIGWDFSQIRGMGSTIDGISGVGGGIIPWLRITNDIAIAVDQLGTRKGAIAAWCEIWHIDIEDFIELRKNSGDERRRAHDLFPALWICDLFMNRVKEDKNWTLFDPYHFRGLSDVWGQGFEDLYTNFESSVAYVPSLPGYKVVKARDLWKKILTQAFETGLPFVGFKDTANRTNPNKHVGMIRSSNLCTEIFQNTSPSRLEYEVTYCKTKGGDDINHKEYYTRIYPAIGGISSEACLSTKYGHKYVPVGELRPGDYVLDDRYKFGDYDQVKFVAKQSAEDGQTAVCTLGSINLSKLEFFDADGKFNPGAYEDLKETVTAMVHMLNAVIDLNSYPIVTAKNSQDNIRALGIGIMGEAELMATNKIRYGSEEHQILINYIFESISYNAIRASTNMLNSGPEAYEKFPSSEWSKGKLPFKFYDRINKKTFKSERGIEGDSSCNWTSLSNRIKNKGLHNGHLLAIAPTSSISILCGTTQSIEPYYGKYWYEENISGLIPAIAPGWSKDLEEYFVTAYELDPKELINLAVIRQRWIDQGQSLNLFVNPDIGGKELSDLYMSAWEKGLKSIYYCRTKSKELNSSTMVACPIDCESCQ